MQNAGGLALTVSKPLRKIHVVMRNRQVLFTSTYPDKLVESFSFRPPGYYFSPRYKMGIWDGRIKMMSRGKVATGLFLELYKDIEEELKVKFVVKDERSLPSFNPLPESIASAIRSYQAKIVRAMVRHSNAGGLVLSATGTGKTFMAGAYFARLDGTGVFVVDELGLLEQTRKELEEVLQEKVGIVGASVFAPQRITAAMIQSLHIHRNRADFRKWFAAVDVIIVDEVHVALNRRNVDVIQTVKPKAVFGLTATLQMRSAEVRFRAAAMTGPVISTYTLEEGVRDSVLSVGVCVTVPCSQPEPVRAGKYQSDYRDLVVHSDKRNQLIVALVEEAVARKRRVVVTAERLEHLDILSAALTHIPHRVIRGNVRASERARARADMDAGTLSLILTNRVFFRGANIKTCDTIVDATAAPSANNVIQRYGRGTRTETGKHGLIYLDIRDLGNRFETAANRRLRSMHAAGVPVKRYMWCDGPGALEFAQTKLKVLLRRRKTKKTGGEDSVRSLC